LSGLGQVDDMNKDLDDMLRRAENAQLIRLSGNYLELSFNLGQLQALTPPTTIADDWSSGIAKLEGSLDTMSEVLSSFISDEATLGDMIVSIEEVRARVNALVGIINKI
jgi:hypothetical protein